MSKKSEKRKVVLPDKNNKISKNESSFRTFHIG